MAGWGSVARVGEGVVCLHALASVQPRGACVLRARAVVAVLPVATTAATVRWAARGRLVRLHTAAQPRCGSWVAVAGIIDYNMCGARPSFAGGMQWRGVFAVTRCPAIAMRVA